jgi:hypothetical protein
MALPRRPSSLICRRRILLASLAQSRGDPCINVLLGRIGGRPKRTGHEAQSQA